MFKNEYYVGRKKHINYVTHYTLHTQNTHGMAKSVRAKGFSGWGIRNKRK